MRTRERWPLLCLRNVRKSYTLGNITVEALKGISLDIERGEFASIMGPSGSGKSTLLNIIGALDLPTSGEIFLKGEPLHMMRDKELTPIRRKKIGIVFQFFNLIGVLTALENIMLPMSGLKIDDVQKMDRAFELLNMVGLEGKADRLPMQLSGGERQRVSIARALVNNPLIVLADEPTGNIDQENSREIMKLFEKLNHEHKQTFLIVTHNPVIASRTHRIIKIKDGLLENGT